MQKITIVIAFLVGLTLTAFAGEGLSGASVALAQKNGGKVLETVQTNADGSFTFKTVVPNGAFTLQVKPKGHPTAYEGYVELEIVAPRDVASGQSTGKRQHKPYMVTKELGARTAEACSVKVTVDAGVVSGRVTKTRSNIQNN